MKIIILFDVYNKQPQLSQDKVAIHHFSTNSVVKNNNEMISMLCRIRHTLHPKVKSNWSSDQLILLNIRSLALSSHSIHDILSKVAK